MKPPGPLPSGTGDPVPDPASPPCFLEAEPLSETTFQAMRDLLFEHTGISLAPGKQMMVQGRLARRLRALGLSDYGTYLDRLTPGNGEEWTQFINALTTNLTRFFREPHHFRRLEAWLQAHPGHPPRIWSAGCSTGEEPYSLALVLLDTLGPHCKGHILATDLDSSVLDRARQGIYEASKAAELDPKWLRLGFMEGEGPVAGRLRVRPELQRLISFEQQNLLSGPFPPEGSLDAVFCRNVLIYFERSTQRSLVERFRACLRPGGLLCLGHSEAMAGRLPGLRALGGTAWERTEDVP